MAQKLGFIMGPEQLAAPDSFRMGVPYRDGAVLIGVDPKTVERRELFVSIDKFGAIGVGLLDEKLRPTGLQVEDYSSVPDPSPGAANPRQVFDKPVERLSFRPDPDRRGSWLTDDNVPLTEHNRESIKRLGGLVGTYGPRAQRVIGAVPNLDAARPDIVRLKAPVENSAVQLGRSNPESIPHQEMIVYIGNNVVRMTLLDAQGQPKPFQIELHKCIDAVDPYRTNGLYALHKPAAGVTMYRRSSGLWSVESGVTVNHKTRLPLQILAEKVGMGALRTQQKRLAAHGRHLPSSDWRS